MRAMIRIFAAALAASIGVAAGAAPADPKASQGARDTLFYLSEVHKRPAQNIVTGQHVASAACCNAADEVMEAGVAYNLAALVQRTGQTPGMMGWDYNDYDLPRRAPVADFGPLNALIIAQARAGSLTTIGWHAVNPFTKKAFNDISCPAPFTDLADPQTAAGAAWRTQLDRVATGLGELQKAGVTVLWRPFLEMNGEFFWWGNCHPTPDQFRTVWKNMFDYFTTARGLHNLLWVYSQNNGSPAPLLYPGDDLVDVLGFDDYHDAIVFPGYAAWAAHGKPLAFTERGAHDDKGASPVFRNLLPAIALNKWRIAYVMSWAGKRGAAYNPGAKDFMNDELAANQSDVKRAMDCLAGAKTAGARSACVLQ